LDQRNLALFYDRNDGMWTKVRSATPPVTGAGSCTDTNFDCTSVWTSGSPGYYPSMAIGSAGDPWVAHYDLGNQDLLVSHYVGTGGTGCATTTWTCSTVASTGTVGVT